jgi:hypothetical protein
MKEQGEQLRELARDWVYKVYAWRGRSPGFMQTQVSRLVTVAQSGGIMKMSVKAAKNDLLMAFIHLKQYLESPQNEATAEERLAYVLEVATGMADRHTIEWPAEKSS